MDIYANLVTLSKIYHCVWVYVSTVVPLLPYQWDDTRAYVPKLSIITITMLRFVPPVSLAAFQRSMNEARPLRSYRDHQ